MKMPIFARKLMHFRGGDTPWDSLGSLLRLPDGHATFQTCVDRESFDVPGGSCLEPLENRALLAAISEFALPTPNALPAGIASGIVSAPGGSLWFTEPGANQIGEVTTAGHVTTYSIPTPASGPQGITYGPDGNLWFTEAAANQIGEMSTSGVILNTYTIPGLPSNPQGITAGPDGNLWFTQAATGQIGRINPSTGAVAEFSILTPGGQPSGITTGPDGNLWFTEPAANQIGRIAPSTGTVTEFAIKTPGGRPQGITTGPDGNLWFTESAAAKVGNISPTTDVVTEYTVPTPGGVTQGITAGSDGNLWFTEPGTAQVGRVTPSGVVTEFATPTKSSQPWGIAAGSDGNLWFTEPGANNVAQVAVAQLITVTPLPVTVQAGNPSTLNIASFTSASVNPLPANFTATIDWGDGTGSVVGTVSASASGSFIVSATKTYSTVGTYQAQVTVTDGEGATATANAAVTVAYSATGNTLSLVAGQRFSGQVAAFNDPQTTGQVGQYSASINWGDGTPDTTGLIAYTGGTAFTVDGLHTYADPGPYNFTVTVNGPDGRTFMAYGQAVVHAAPLQAVPVSFKAVRGAPFTGVVATFSDQDPLSTASDFAAVIVWGDGHTSAGTIVAQSAEQLLLRYGIEHLRDVRLLRSSSHHSRHGWIASYSRVDCHGRQSAAW